MTTVGEILDRLAVDLNDAEPGRANASWGREQLRRYVADAVRVVFGYKPEAFVKDAVIAIEACREYSPVAPCDMITHDCIVGACTREGYVTHPLRPCSDDAAVRWPGRSCPPSRPYRMRDYSLSKDGRGIRASPPLPPGGEAWIAARCPVRPSAFGDDVVLDDDIAPAVVQWCLCQAKLVDGENNVAVLAVAKEHEDEFWKLMGVGANIQANKQRREAKSFT
jgi:hypothetical protein